MLMRTFLAAVCFMCALAGESAGQADEARWDSNMALTNAVVDADGVKWIDGRFLPLEGRAFDDVECFFDRLPAHVTTNVNEGVREMKHHTSGMLFRFKTDSRHLTFRWIPRSEVMQMDHMPATGESGIDVYRLVPATGKWRYVNTGRIRNAEQGGTLRVPWTPGTACLVNLPLYNGLKSFMLGIDRDAVIEALPPRASGVDKPVVFYGTSITHGGCCSRPGLAFVNRIGRDLDVPVVGLGFSGSGIMELEMSEHIARIDASCFVLDCLWNMGSAPDHAMAGRNVEENYEPFIRNLRRKRPDVPIVMAEACDVHDGEGEYSPRLDAMDRFARRLYDRLIAEGWKNLYYLPKDGMYGDDFEGTVDGVHPNDLGMKTMAHAFGKVIGHALGLDDDRRCGK